MTNTPWRTKKITPAKSRKNHALSRRRNFDGSKGKLERRYSEVWACASDVTATSRRIDYSPIALTSVHVIRDHGGNRNHPAPAGRYFALISR
jgi:hypothetical protein